MSVYSNIYKTFSGHGIGKNPLVVKVMHAYMGLALRNPILVNNSFYMYLDSQYGNTLMLDKTYEPDGTAAIDSAIKDGWIALDLGANIGYFTLLMAQKCRKVYSFEPSDSAFGLLQKNVKLNKLQDKVTLENKAVGSASSNMKLYHEPLGSGGNSFVNIAGGDSEDVECVSLDEYFKGKEKPDIIKMDVEGWEEDAILGGKEVFKNAQFILFENNVTLLVARHKKGTEVMDMLKGFGFEIKKIDGGNMNKQDREKYSSYLSLEGNYYAHKARQV